MKSQIREYLNPRYYGKEDLKSKVIVITGANTGIGKEVAKQLAQRGGRVVMGCRDELKCMKARKEIILETKNPNVICRQIDLSSLKSVREFAHFINQSKSFSTISLDFVFHY
jgi:E3 ubiquitin-protein ligase SIAH1